MDTSVQRRAVEVCPGYRDSGAGVEPIGTVPSIQGEASGIGNQIPDAANCRNQTETITTHHDQ
jgi:hypothetical protein